MRRKISKFKTILKLICMAIQFPNVQAIRENLSLKDIIFSSIPTVPTYTGMLNGILPEWLVKNTGLMLLLAIGMLLIFLTLLFFFNNEANKRSLAQILATGYFQNFSGKLYFLLMQNTELNFMLPHGKTMMVHPSKIKIEINLPASLQGLREKSADINSNTQIAYIDSSPFNEPFWVRVKTDDQLQAVSICEIPRTLFAIPQYLSQAYTQKTSLKMHKAFNDKFKQLLQDNANLIPIQQFIVKEGDQS